jgi:hypothetical protein
VFCAVALSVKIRVNFITYLFLGRIDIKKIKRKIQLVTLFLITPDDHIGIPKDRPGVQQKYNPRPFKKSEHNQ